MQNTSKMYLLLIFMCRNSLQKQGRIREGRNETKMKYKIKEKKSSLISCASVRPQESKKNEIASY